MTDQYDVPEYEPEPSDDPDWLDWLADAIAEEWEDEAA